MSDALTTTGGQCLCGAVKFQAQLPTLWVAHCHCTLCQRAHGAGVVTWAGFEASHARIEDAEAQLRWYASSPQAERGFCARCGSSLFFRSTRWPNELHVARVYISGPIDKLPQAHVYYDTHVEWLSLADQLPRQGSPA